MTTRFRENDALLIVDVQHDFCPGEPGGALAVADGDTIVPMLNRWIEAAQREGIPIYASRDWHPERHVSFKERGGPWPVHCVQGTPGAELHSHLRLPADAAIISKGQNLDRDQYSAFEDTGLADMLRKRGVERIWIGGLALDVCVRATALDGLKAGFDVRLILDATRPVDVEAGERTVKELREAGAAIVEDGEQGP